VSHVLAVVLDRAHARFFDVGPSETVELPCLQSPATRGGRFHSDREDAPGRGEHAYHGRIREEARRHMAAIVERLVALEQRDSSLDFVLAGPGDAARSLRGVLPPTLDARVIGTTRLDPALVTPAVVRRTAQQFSEAHDRDLHRALVVAMLEGLGTGRAENGIRPVLRALAQGRARTLLVRADTREPGFRCTQSRRLVLSALECRGEGDPIRLPDILTAAVGDAKRQGASVTLIADREIAKPIDGLAALLRF